MPRHRDPARPRLTRRPLPREAVRVAVHLAPATRDGLLVLAARHGQSMASFLRGLVEQTVAEAETKPNGRK